jgi:hypothetical protein
MVLIPGGRFCIPGSELEKLPVKAKWALMRGVFRHRPLFPQVDWSTALDRMTRIFFPLLLVFGLDSCGNLKMNPLKKTESKYECYGDPDDAKTLYSALEESLYHRGALRSGKIIMESGVGMMEKTVRLFALKGNKMTFVFHFMHPIDIEIKDHAYSIRGDSGELDKGTMELDSRTTIG